MKKPIVAAVGQVCLLLFLLVSLSFTACKSFPKGYRLMLEGENKRAVEIFKKRENHRTYGPGATYYKEMLGLAGVTSMSEWGRVHNLFCELEEQVKNMPLKKIHKLAKYQVRPARIRESRENLEMRILEHLCLYGTIAHLDSLYANFPCWITKDARDSVRDVVVNMTIDPRRPVYENKCQERLGAGSGLGLPEERVKGFPCVPATLRRNWNIRYDDAIGIIERYSDAVKEFNYPAFWDIQEHIWDIYKLQYSYCEMSRFKNENPNDEYARDCWFDNARDTFCLDLLRPVLAFHRNNAHTVLDIEVCNQILCLSLIAQDAAQLDAAEKAQLEDVGLMSDLQQQFICRKFKFEAPELISKVAYLAEKYVYHKAVYDLAREMANYFYTTGQMAYARQVAQTLAPLFPDLETCPTQYDFQVAKQKWFANYAALLQRAGDSIALVQPVAAWNTPEHHEYALVSWAENDEVYFVRRHPLTGSAQVMTSRSNGASWSKPAPVRELSVADDIEPLSITADGRYMLLRSGGRLLQSYRHDTRRPWSKPDPLPMAFRFGGWAMLSPDASLLLLEDYATRKTVLGRPRKDIFVSRLGADGRYGRPESIGEKINLPGSNEGSPYLAIGGRMLIFTSNREDALGHTDLYSVTLQKAGDWTTALEPANMGLQVNTVYEDFGITHFSEYTGEGFFHRRDQCSGDLDIWRIPALGGVPENALRLAGIVLDENSHPITGGFMEFTTDYNLHTHAQLISAKGTYSHTTPDSSEVVRLFPEIPGYYSERDTTHFLARAPKGKIIRDTFYLTSFEHIRQHFKLRYSTFVNGTAEFDNPLKAYPELTRLAKIATRMGAELELTGHTDSTGAEGLNHELAFNRAQSVKQFLVEKCGFASEKIKVFGFGPTRPICSNATEEGRRCNRRVEVVFRMPVLPSQKASTATPATGGGG